jgi:hypothetical protein
MMEIKTGARLRSAVCATEAIVVRAASGDVDLRCGGAPMVGASEVRDPSATPDAAFSGGSLMGKRYADETLGLELLVTKPGAGTLSLGDTPLPLKEAKALPSSD